MELLFIQIFREKVTFLISDRCDVEVFVAALWSVLNIFLSLVVQFSSFSLEIKPIDLLRFLVFSWSNILFFLVLEMTSKIMWIKCIYSTWKDCNTVYDWKSFFIKHVFKKELGSLRIQDGNFVQDVRKILSYKFKFDQNFILFKQNRNYFRILKKIILLFSKDID